MPRSYPERPIVGVGAIILNADRTQVALVKRGQEPLKGEWSLPGGVVELGETTQEAVVREALEETGLRIQTIELSGVFDRIIPDNSGRPKFHYVLIDYLCRVVGGELRPGSDAEDVRWVTASELGSLPMTAGTRAVIARYLDTLATRH